MVMDLTIWLISKFDCPEVFGHLFLGFQDGSKGVGPIVKASVKACGVSVLFTSDKSIFLPRIVSLPNFSVQVYD